MDTQSEFSFISTQPEWQILPEYAPTTSSANAIATNLSHHLFPLAHHQHLQQRLSDNHETTASSTTSPISSSLSSSQPQSFNPSSLPLSAQSLASSNTSRADANPHQMALLHPSHPLRMGRSMSIMSSMDEASRNQLLNRLRAKHALVNLQGRLTDSKDPPSTFEPSFSIPSPNSRYTSQQKEAEQSLSSGNSVSSLSSLTSQMQVRNDVFAYAIAASLPYTAQDVDSDKDSESRVLAAARRAFREPALRDLLPGEWVIESYPHVMYLGQHESSGSLFLSEYRLVFVPQECSTYEESTVHVVDIPLTFIHRIEKQIQGRASDNEGVEIYCKDFRIVRFIFYNQAFRDRFLKEVKAKCFLLEGSSSYQLFAYAHGNQIASIRADMISCQSQRSMKETGWNIFDHVQEFSRQGISKSIWRFTEVNTNGAVSESYPDILVVPSKAADEMIRSSASFRTKGRFPALTWYNAANQAAILRSSQPKVGLGRTRSAEDEAFLNEILDCTIRAPYLYILDCRPFVNAYANQARGAGYENPSYYTRCKLEFFGIENIHMMRESFKKVEKLCQDGFSKDDFSTFASAFEATKWHEHLRSILVAAAHCAELVEHDGVPVLVHCSDGWDRTSQVCSLAQVLLDPYYRTIKGFEVLVEKDWCQFGHPFEERIGHAASLVGFWDGERSPIFLQFIEAVWQLMQQFPYAFEFNESFLILILDHLYCCRFGTFLKNHVNERKQLSLQDRTASLWGYLNSISKALLNPYYSTAKLSESGRKRLVPMISSCRLKFWFSYFTRWDNRIADSLSHGEFFKEKAMHDLKLENEVLKAKVREMERKSLK
eukprot:TRINITY_DN9449_c0_g1_i1.p1 TRINITY_DN9449_c0_g1~~TRINITY_DN9449_c0_g1_i1.p1  ORF type:complete len:827 (+),score=158.77 TRINITY_DN9449_c0_g1_i1:75-2555(+)